MRRPSCDRLGPAASLGKHAIGTHVEVDIKILDIDLAMGCKCNTVNAQKGLKHKRLAP
jgi:hypothetical protein